MAYRPARLALRVDDRGRRGTMNTNAFPPSQNRLAALWRFAFAITLLNVLGHTVLGFEQSVAQPLVGVGVAYATELTLEWLAARAEHRAPQYRGGFRRLVEF